MIDPRLPPRDARRADPLALTDASGLPVYADDGTDLTVIRWMLSLSPEQRLRWLQTHMQGVAALAATMNQARNKPCS